MPTISNVSFTVKFDLTGTPKLVLTDTTSSPPADLVGIFSITQPDRYERTGDIDDPDITDPGGSFEFPLTLDSNGEVQCGEYIIIFTAAAAGYLSTDFTRQFDFDYEPVELDMVEYFDVFTPELTYNDETAYARDGWNNGSVTRVWQAISTPTGTIDGASQLLDLIFGGNYYDANYTITLISSLLYTHQTYAWLTIDEEIEDEVQTYAMTPPSIESLVEQLSDLRETIATLDRTCRERCDKIMDFTYAESLLGHIVRKACMSLTDGIFEDLKQLVTVLNENHIPTYSPTNDIIEPYDTSSLCGTGSGGSEQKRPLTFIVGTTLNAPTSGTNTWTLPDFENSYIVLIVNGQPVPLSDPLNGSYYTTKSLGSDTLTITNYLWQTNDVLTYILITP